jgi:hypothetical protein
MTFDVLFLTRIFSLSLPVSLEGVTRHLAISPQKFIAFFLTVERSDGQHYDENDDIGRFQIIEPAISKISEKCNNLVVNTNTGAKPAVTVSIHKSIPTQKYRAKNSLSDETSRLLFLSVYLFARVRSSF